MIVGHTDMFVGSVRQQMGVWIPLHEHTYYIVHVCIMIDRNTKCDVSRKGPCDVSRGCDVSRKGRLDVDANLALLRLCRGGMVLCARLFHCALVAVMMLCGVGGIGGGPPGLSDD